MGQGFSQYPGIDRAESPGKGPHRLESRDYPSVGRVPAMPPLVLSLGSKYQRLTESATQAGFDAPSISSVTRKVACTVSG
ncbi:MAG: hypothetical protein EBX60_01455 [Betaproteobacteria bacterium]|nr:hypothetical protein [Betaproteobacteria bacterium]